MCVTCGCGVTGDVEFSVDEHEHVHADGTRHSHGHDHDHDHAHAHADGTRHSHGHDHGDAHDHAHAHDHDHGHAHDHDYDHVHGRGPGPVPGRDRHAVDLEAQILGKNQLIAERNRGWLAGRGVLALNLVSSPGAGKTTLLERTLNDLKREIRIGVIEGDQATSNDAERIRATGVRAVQINTGTGCHLEADMLERAIGMLQPERDSLMLIENVGNLVCPALFDLGERAKVVVFSVTEGEDKPLKYPHMFSAASVVLLSKIDLLPYVRFDVSKALANARTVNPGLTFIELSAYSGEGLNRWYDWLRSELGHLAGRAA